MEWINASEECPSEDFDQEDCHEYYLVYLEEYGAQKAMYFDGTWHPDYTSAITDRVTHWLKIVKPQRPKPVGPPNGVI